MSLLQATILGLVQGLSELLPISSSGHLIIVSRVFNWPDQGLAFDAIIHLGTFAAIFIIFWADIKKIFTHLKPSPEGITHPSPLPRGDFTVIPLQWRGEGVGNVSFLKIILIAILPALAVGFFFGERLENLGRRVDFVALNLIFWGVVLWLADRRERGEFYDYTQIDAKKSLVIGLAQILALLPGTSRSGITITTGLFQKFNRELAVKFSFLISLPVVFLSGAWEAVKLAQAGILGAELSYLAVGLIASFISGIMAIKFIFYLVKKHNFTVFVIYRIVLGILLLIFL